MTNSLDIRAKWTEWPIDYNNYCYHESLRNWINYLY